MRRRALLGLTAATVLGGTAGCGAPPTTPPSAAPDGGYDPEDPLGVVAAAIDELHHVGAATVHERWPVPLDGEAVEARTTFAYDTAHRAVLIDTSARLADGTPAAVRFALLEQALVMAAPEQWQQPADTWYRIDPGMFGTGQPTPWYLSDQSPVGTIEALTRVQAPARLTAGDESSDLLRYELELPGSSAVQALPARLRARLLEAPEELYLEDFTAPVSVSVDAGGTLVAASMDLTHVLNTALPQELFDPAVVQAVTTPAQVDVTVGTPSLWLPDLAAALPAAEMPEPLPLVLSA